ncbi:MAG TPA: hypothetical protein VI564_01780 [Candidatus Nanoarchaeia archaeon]|nr:hypothetical protein [Candidatus Nanoarchaeia archaeon]
MNIIDKDSHDGFEIEEDTNVTTITHGDFRITKPVTLIFTAGPYGHIVSNQEATIIFEPASYQIYSLINTPSATIYFNAGKKGLQFYGKVIAHKINKKGEVTYYNEVYEAGKLTIKGHGERGEELLEDTEINSDVRGDIISNRPITITLVRGESYFAGTISAPHATVVLKGGLMRKLDVRGSIFAHKVVIQGKVDINSAVAKVYEDGRRVSIGNKSGQLSTGEDQVIKGAIIGGTFSGDVIKEDKPVTITIKKTAFIRGNIAVPNGTVVLEGGWVKRLVIQGNVKAHKVIRKGRVVVTGGVYEDGKLVSDY